MSREISPTLGKHIQMSTAQELSKGKIKTVTAISAQNEYIDAR